MPKIKLVACDMDGTLLDSDKKISEKNIEAVRRLKQEGIYFVIATGRHDSMIKAYLDELGIEMPVISCNGALVRNPFSDRMFSSTPIEKDKVIKIAEISRDAGAVYHVYCHHLIYGEKMNGKLPYYRDLNSTLPEREHTKLYVDEDYKNFLNTTPEEFYKVLVLCSDGPVLDQITQEITDQTGLVPAQSAFELTDVMQNGATKASALKELINKLGIKVEETAAIGDFLNDLEMIQFAGTGIAMSNAITEIKAAADMITEKDHNNSGVAEAIDRLLAGV